ncbi:MAG: SurA N-terminal domain-containing protein [Chloroflexota bacterium]
MAKKGNSSPPTSTRQSRREQRFAQQQEQQIRTMRMAAFGIIGVILLIIIVGLIVELIFVPNQAVATVNGTDITMRDWQQRVQFERASLVKSIDDNYELFHDAEAEDQDDARQNTIRTLQQFFGNQMGALVNGHQVIGEQVLEGLISNELVRQEAAARSIMVSADEVDAEIGQQYAYFDGGLPTPFPTAENTPAPTPSVTPIPDPALSDVPPTEVPVEEGVEPTEELPTPTPRPTNTPVSLESFEEQRQEDLDAFDNLGADISLDRSRTEESLLFRKLGEALYEENGGTDSAPHISAFLLVYATEEEAEEAMARVDSVGYLQVWNEVRSFPPDPENVRPPQALERLETTADGFERSYSEGIGEALLEVPIGSPTGIIEDVDVQTSLPVYIISQVTSVEELELSEFTLQQLHQEALQNWLTEKRETEGIEVFENWRNRVPRQPSLDQELWQPVPTPTTAAVGS